MFDSLADAIYFEVLFNTQPLMSRGSRRHDFVLSVWSHLTWDQIAVFRKMAR